MRRHVTIGSNSPFSEAGPDAGEPFSRLLFLRSCCLKEVNHLVRGHFSRTKRSAYCGARAFQYALSFQERYVGNCEPEFLQRDLWYWMPHHAHMAAETLTVDSFSGTHQLQRSTSTHSRQHLKMSRHESEIQHIYLTCVDVTSCRDGVVLIYASTKVKIRRAAQLPWGTTPRLTTPCTTSYVLLSGLKFSK